MKCGFCSTVWKTRKAKGTRSAFSWTATLATIIALAAIAFFVGRELGVFSKSSEPIEARSWGTALETSTKSVEESEPTSDAESGEASENVENLESATVEEDAATADETLETANEAENATAE